MSRMTPQRTTTLAFIDPTKSRPSPDRPIQPRTAPRGLEAAQRSACVEFHGGHDGRIAKAERPSAASPNFSQLSARGCTAVRQPAVPD
eukprot:scaffold79259_cov35-Phaeocystis_antarctica.AAC.2